MVNDLHAEPVSARAALIVQDYRRRDPAGYLLIRRGDLAGGHGADLREAVLEEVEVAGLAFGALIYDLANISTTPMGEWPLGKTYHDFDGLAVRPGHLETGPAAGAVAPGGTRKCRSIYARWQRRHGGEGARSAVEVAAVESGSS